MLTLILFLAFALASCLAAAGLIASAQNNDEAARAVAGLDVTQDVHG